MAGDGLHLTIGATRFQKFDGRVLAKAMKGVSELGAIQPKTLALTFPILLKSILAERLTRRGAALPISPK